MILKLERPNLFENFVGWTYYDNIDKLNHCRTQDLKPNDSYDLVIEKNENSNNVFDKDNLHIFIRYRDGNEMQLLTKCIAYILNDEGKTIERIN